MKNITFEQFLLTYNFRDYKDDRGISENEKYDTQIIRVYLPNEDIVPMSEWFEIGLYHFDSGETILKRVQEIFALKLLNSYVYTFNVNINGQLSVYLDYEQKDLDMD